MTRATAAARMMMAKRLLMIDSLVSLISCPKDRPERRYGAITAASQVRYGWEAAASM